MWSGIKKLYAKISCISQVNVTIYVSSDLNDDDNKGFKTMCKWSKIFSNFLGKSDSIFPIQAVFFLDPQEES